MSAADLPRHPESHSGSSASFPDMNPSPVVEVEDTGRVTYLNPAARKLMPDMEQKGFSHPWLGGIDSRFVAPSDTAQSVLSRDCELEGRWYHQEGYQVPFTPRRIRIYAFDVTEGRRAQAMARESMLILRSLIESSSDTFFVMDRDLRMVLCNSNLARALGKKPEDMYGKTDIENGWDPELVNGNPEKGIKGWESDDREVLGGKTVRAAQETVDFGGEKRFFDTVKTPLRDEEGTIIGMLGIGRDVTERVLADRELKKSERRYRTLFTNMLHGYAYCRMIFENDEPRDFVYLDVNTAFEEHTGLKGVVGKRVTEVIPGIRESQPELFRTYGRVAQTGGSESFEIYLDSLGVWLAVSAYSTEKGYFTAMVENITERKRAAGALQEQAALLDLIADAIVVRDLGGHILYWNKAAEKMYGWSAEEVLGEDVDRLLGTREAELEHAYKTVLETGHWAGDFSRKSRDGRELAIEARWTVVRDATGNPTSILAVNTDATERRSVQSQLFRAQRLESLGTLAGGIAHDLNNVLSPILMGVEALSLQHGDDDTRKILEIVKAAAQRGASIVRQVLSFARGTGGERSDIQLKHIAREVLQIIGETFPKSIRVESRIDGDLHAVSGDATQLHQVLMNLCVNARDAMPDGGTITLSAYNVTLDQAYARMHLEARPIRYVVLNVEDTGEGIAADVAEKIFDPFFTTKEPGKGTGLGLSTTRSIVKSHGGFINVYSEPGKGSSFKVYIPTASQEAEAGAEDVEEGAPMGEGELILVVDDEAAVREIARQILESYGYRIIVAGDGTEALARYVQQRSEVRVVITDMMMPYMDGAATIRALRRLDPSVRIIATSGLVANGQSKEALALGVDAILSKPYTADTLLQTIRRVLALPPRSPGSS